MKNGKHLTLAIESSCDETSVALVADGRTVLSNVISSQIDIHKLYGGVVPEIASRHHLENINGVTDMALRQGAETLGVAALAPEDIDLIGVTKGPGLIGALLIGVATAKAYALAWRRPLVGVHHIKGHLSANYIEFSDLAPPFLALIVSGGHTSIIDVRGYNDLVVLGSTRDDALGEAYDKVARVLGLPYPGGPQIDRVAREGDPAAIGFKRVMLEEGSLDFSFSGTKTGVLNYVNQERQQGRELFVPDVAASFQQAVLDTVVAKTFLAAQAHTRSRLAVAGGVAANTKLRAMLTEECARRDMELFLPSPLLCTDNAAMIGCAAYYQYEECGADDLSLDAVASYETTNEFA